MLEPQVGAGSYIIVRDNGWSGSVSLDYPFPDCLVIVNLATGFELVQIVG